MVRYGGGAPPPGGGGGGGGGPSPREPARRGTVGEVDGDLAAAAPGLAGAGVVADRPVEEVVELAASSVVDDRVGERRRAVGEGAGHTCGRKAGQGRVVAGHPEVSRS